MFIITKFYIGIQHTVYQSTKLFDLYPQNVAEFGLINSGNLIL